MVFKRSKTKKDKKGDDKKKSRGGLFRRLKKEDAKKEKKHPTATADARDDRPRPAESSSTTETKATPPSPPPLPAETTEFLLRHAVENQCVNRESLHETIHRDYAHVLVKQTVAAESASTACLVAAGHVVDQFVDVTRKYTLSRSVRRQVWSELQAYLLPRMRYHYGKDRHDLTPRDAAQMISWIDTFQTQLARHGVEASPSWNQDLERLVELYMAVGVRAQLEEMFNRTFELESGDDMFQNDAGHIVTRRAQNIAFIVQAQVETAQDFLPRRYLQSILSICAIELSQKVVERIESLESSWRQIGASRYCAVINDSTHLSDLLEETFAQHIDDSAYLEQCNTVLRSLSKLAVSACTHLCQRIFWDLREPDPILTSIGSREWEEDGHGHAVQRTIATLTDYLVDVQAWLATGFYYPKILRACYDETLQTYVESFFTNTLEAGVAKPKVVSARLETDYGYLVEFFNGSIFESYFGRAFYEVQQINTRLHILQNMSNVLDPINTPADLALDVTAVLSSFAQQEDDTSVLLHLVGLRGRQKQSCSAAWLATIARCKLEVANEKTKTKESLLFELPDMRNSVYAWNLKASDAELRKKDLSNRTMQAARATGQHLKGPRPLKMFRMRRKSKKKDKSHR